MEINKLDFEGFYIKKPTNKNQIVLHHTVSGGKAQGVVDYWKSHHNKTGLWIGTHFVIDRDGKINQLFDLRYWAGHIGDCSKSCHKLNLPKQEFSKGAIGIELINWGGLKEEVNGNLHNAYNKPFNGNAVNISYRGYDWFEAYTGHQIDALAELLPHLIDWMDISYVYNPGIWDINSYALTNKEGIYSHTSYRMDKSDIYPDERIVDLLKNL